MMNKNANIIYCDDDRYERYIMGKLAPPQMIEMMTESSSILKVKTFNSL